MLKKYLEFAIEKNVPLKIITQNNKLLYVNIISFENSMVKYKFLSSNYEGKIKFENIKKYEFKEKAHEIDFLYSNIEKKYNIKDVKKNIEKFKKYYIEIIDLLLSKEEEQTKEYINLINKKKFYLEMFEKLYLDEDNLLYYYFSKFKFACKNKENYNYDNILLLQQSNNSQKEALINALNNRISIIQGPPGTGKTTTIINILANLVYLNKKVVVVSKNNSAIDNIVEELDYMNLPKFYIRFGNSTIMEENVERNIKNILLEYKKHLSNINIRDLNNDISLLNSLIADINIKEKTLNNLVDKNNELQELKNQLRHVKKKSDAYDINDFEKLVKMKYLNNEGIWLLKKRLSILAKTLVLMDNNKKLSILDKILSYLASHQNIDYLHKNGILIHLLLEEKYLERLISKKEDELQRLNFNELSKEIKDGYKKIYIPKSESILKQTIKKHVNLNDITNILNGIENCYTNNDNIKMPILKKYKNDIIKLFPVILTTVDSILSNFDSYFKDCKKIDYIIIDEASQCDILSALPLLYIAKNIVIVGDSKQLNAITTVDKSEINFNVDKEFDYFDKNFLTTIVETIDAPSKMLIEHYRCDYSIINYCNKYFYDGKLKIYNTAKKGAISFVDDDKGKYVVCENKSYSNDREIKSIEALIDNIDDKFIITPFKGQALKLKEIYDEKRCGTIHTFQGRGEKQVFFTAVLNNTEECRRHINGKNNLFTKELINVAVSRAKEKFTLIADTKFFKDNDKNMKNLIEYLEIYGDKIPDKSTCIFDNLYKQIPTYEKHIPNIDNIYEEKLYELLKNYVAKSNKYKLKCKLPLAEFVTDKKYLNNNMEYKKFILNNSHVDFCIYTDNIKKPILTIELDGKDHDDIIQKQRDTKKNSILEDMGIKLLRVKSKIICSEEELFKIIDNKINS